METVATQPKPTRRDERVLVHDWRLTQLRLVGFNPQDAAHLARHTEVDLHQALGLVLCGCPPTIALQILL